MINVFIDGITDVPTREAVRQLVDQLNQVPMIKGEWQFVEVTVTSAVTDHVVYHQLGFKPSDVILLGATAGADVFWTYDDFTNEYVLLNTTGATTVRAFVGTYRS